jgi:hypothetical protein
MAARPVVARPAGAKPVGGKGSNGKQNNGKGGGLGREGLGTGDRLLVPRIEQYAQNNDDFTDVDATVDYLRCVTARLSPGERGESFAATPRRPRHHVAPSGGFFLAAAGRYRRMVVGLPVAETVPRAAASPR